MKSASFHWNRGQAALHVLYGMLANATGRVPLPRIAHFCPTWKCNQQCDGCTVWGREPEPELSANQAVAMFAKMPFLDIVKIVGGEPFVHPQIESLVDGIIQNVRPYILQIVTNGSRPDLVESLVKRLGGPNLHIRVSLSGIGATHNSLCVGGSYEKTHQTIETLAELKKSTGTSVGINFRVSDATVDDLPEAIRIYRPMGVDVVPGIHYSPFLTDTDVKNTDFEFDFVDPKKLLDAMEQIPTERANMSWIERFLVRRFTHDSSRRVLIAKKPKARFGCRELRNLMYILPSGALVTCGLIQKPLFNLAKQDFHEIWKSKEMNKHRKAVDECPGCPQAAIEIFSRLYGGSASKPPPKGHTPL